MTNRNEFLKYAAHDKRLLELSKSITEHTKRHRKDKKYCANVYWYRPGGFKSQLVQLVGYGAETEELKTEEAYDVCYKYLYNLLPDCKHDGILCWG